MTLMKLVGATFISAALWCGTAIGAETYPEMNLRLAHTYHPTTVQSQIDQWWADEIRKRSNGKIDIKIFWSETLAKQIEVLDTVGKGAADFGVTITSFYPEKLPLNGVTNSLPLAFDNPRQAQIIHTELVERIPEMQEELKRNGVWPLFWHGLGEFRTICTEPVRTIEDYKGLNIRSYGVYVPQLWNSLGANPVTAFPAEIYEGLQRGLLDCSYFPHDLAHSFKVHEVAKYANTANFGAITTWPIFVNYEKWQEWPENVKALIREVSAEAAQRDREAIVKTDRDALQTMKKEGGVEEVEFEDQDKLENVAPDFYQIWIERMEEKGLGDPARRIVDYWKKRLKELREKKQ